MAQEIIYTSAQKGLKQGSRGFCTVVSTAGMAANMAERLESMSGYRHAFPLNDPKAALNPVNYAHVTTRMAGQKLNVISRVADAGQDYSGRTNKLAHHIVIDDVASLTAGPARLLADSTVVTTAWDGKLATRPPRNILGPEIPETVQLSVWKSVTGDGGWCGYVAEQLMSSRAPLNVIFPPGTDTLALVCEVLDMVPIPQRWGITFSTYFTRLQAGTECQLRFVLDGTNEAASLRNDARAIKVDLASTLAAATGGPLVEQARAGELEFRQTVIPAAVRPSRHKAVSDDELEGLLDSENEASAAVDAMNSTERSHAHSKTAASIPPPVSRLNKAFEQKEAGSGKWLITSLVLLLICGIGAGVYMVAPTITQYVETMQQASKPLDVKPAVESPELTESEKPGPPPPLPFNGDSPFAKVGEVWGGTGSDFELKLAKIGDGEESVAATLLIDDFAKLKFDTDDVGFVVDPQTVGNSEAEWHVYVDARLVGKIYGEIVDTGQRILRWRSAEFELSNTELRRASYDLQEKSLRLTAPSNHAAGDDEVVSLRFMLPPLFDGKSPLVELKNDSSGPFQWKPDAELEIYAYDVGKVTWKLQGNGGLQIAKRPAGDSWEIKSGKCLLATISHTTKPDGAAKFTWNWTAEDSDAADVSRGRYLLAGSNLQLSVDREDLQKSESAEVRFDFPPPSAFVSVTTQNGNTNRLPLPNPYKGDKLSEEDCLILRSSEIDSVHIKPHPGFERIAAGDWKLEIKPVTVQEKGTRVWRATLRDEPLAEYTLQQTKPETLDEYRLQFKWTGDCENFGEWLRWCPILIAVDKEEKVFLQRQPDQWAIPTLDRARDAIIGPNHLVLADPYHTGTEFRDLEIPAAEYTQLSLEFRSQGGDPQVFTKQLKDVESVTRFYCQLPASPDEQLKFQDNMKQQSEDIVFGVCEVKIDLRAAAEKRESCLISVSTLAYVTLPQVLASDVKDYDSIFERTITPPKASRNWNTWESEMKSMIDNTLKRTDDQVGDVPLVILKGRIRLQETEFEKRRKLLAEWMNARLVMLEDNVKKAEPEKRADEQLLADGNRRRDILKQLNSRLTDAKSNHSYSKVIEAGQRISDAFANVELNLKLSCAMGEPSPVDVTFIEARTVNDRSEASDDN